MQLHAAPATDMSNAKRPFSSMQPDLSAHDATTMRPLQPAWAMQTDLSHLCSLTFQHIMQVHESPAINAGNADQPF